MLVTLKKKRHKNSIVPYTSIVAHHHISILIDFVVLVILSFSSILCPVLVPPLGLPTHSRGVFLTDVYIRKHTHTHICVKLHSPTTFHTGGGPCQNVIFFHFQGKFSNEQSLTPKQPCSQCVHMLNWNCIHAQLKVRACSTKVCTCSI